MGAGRTGVEPQPAVTRPGAAAGSGDPGRWVRTVRPSVPGGTGGGATARARVGACARGRSGGPARSAPGRCGPSSGPCRGRGPARSGCGCWPAGCAAPTCTSPRATSHRAGPARCRATRSSAWWRSAAQAPCASPSATGSGSPGCAAPADGAAGAGRAGRTSVPARCSPAGTPTAATPSTPSSPTPTPTGSRPGSATPRWRRCCAPGTSGTGRCGGPSCHRVAGWGSTVSARPRTSSHRWRSPRGRWCTC